MRPAVAKADRQGAAEATSRVLGPDTADRRLCSVCGFAVEGVLVGEFRIDGRPGRRRRHVGLPRRPADAAPAAGTCRRVRPRRRDPGEAADGRGLGRGAAPTGRGRGGGAGGSGRPVAATALQVRAVSGRTRRLRSCSCSGAGSSATPCLSHRRRGPG
ncbi:hypothetical protein ACFPM0_31080 [Pseudonocardia sulfidoxydans]|uniref:hypothetical protein n=1 Tax=Pseudonocardia sulfidoxydans TaxID=54011 RepID=UPI00361998F0